MLQNTDDGRPTIGTGSNRLGVRVGPGAVADITPDAAGSVHPGTGGMSCVLGGLHDLPLHTVPKSWGPPFSGSDKLMVYCIAAPQLAAHTALGMRLAEPPPGHHNLEPAETMLLASYEAALHATRDSWEKVERPK